ncbi:MAG: tetratricopeptide repeat protein [Kiritimatiellae bacterium]|nr:tetratricopeptide repeat protein [Kiritimatiellia bacterium]MDW8458019.1 tetratricopeptide repeat protein [Verrucomicrobiota bacterium]
MQPESNTSESPTSPASTAPSLKDRLLEIREVPEAIDFLRENGVAILIGAGAAAALFLGWSLYRNFQAQKHAEAAQLLFSAQSVEQIQEVATRYSSAPVAPLAKLVLAGQAYDQGDYEYAHTLFTQFVQEHPNHDMRDQAAFAAITCLEAAGRFEEAREAYAAFSAERPGHYLSPAAEFARARCLEQMGRLEEARDEYRRFIESAPDDRWRARAESAIAFVEKEIRARGGARNPGLSPVTPITVPTGNLSDRAPATPVAP